MKKEVPTPLIIAAIVVVLLVVGYFSWKSIAPDDGRANIPVPPPPKETANMAARPRPMTPGGFSSNAAKGNPAKQ